MSRPMLRKIAAFKVWQRIKSLTTSKRSLKSAVSAIFRD